MKRLFGIILPVILVLLLIFNIFIVIEKNSFISKNTSNTITEILRCIEDTKECLQNLIDDNDVSNQTKMIYVINGKFSTLYHLCHANRNIYSDACSDFEHIGATFIGPASNRYFKTNGIYDDFEITENEYAYLKELINLLDKANENISGSDSTKDFNALNSNFADIHEQLCDMENSPYRLIKKQNNRVRETLIKVLKNEQTFTVKSLLSNETTEETLTKYHFSTSSDAYYAFVPSNYTFVDLNSDDIEELVIISATLDYYLILRYENSKVYGYNVKARSIIDLKTDGSFMTSSGAGDNSISNFSFFNSTFEINDLAYANDSDNKYLLDGKAVNKETVKKYFDDWNKNTTKVSWEKIN